MPAMRIIETTSSEWGVFFQMRGVLLKANSQHAPRQAVGFGHACSNSKVPREPITYSDFGVREPDIDETPLSIDECWIAVRECLT